MLVTRDILAVVGPRQDDHVGRVVTNNFQIRLAGDNTSRERKALTTSERQS